jgi:hypothetical protein
MLLTPQHRRSTRNRAVKKVTSEDIYEDCPCFPGFEYDKDYYLASSSYSTFIDTEIAKMWAAAAATKSDD